MKCDTLYIKGIELHKNFRIMLSLARHSVLCKYHNRINLCCQYVKYRSYLGVAGACVFEFLLVDLC